MSLILDIEDYREPKSDGVSNVKYPSDRSCDNSPLFTATYIHTLYINTFSSLSGFGELIKELSWFYNWTKEHEIEPGMISQYPLELGGSENETAHDDLHVAAINGMFAERVHSYGKNHAWCWNTKNPMEPLPKWYQLKRWCFWKRDGFDWRLWFARHPGFTSFIKLAGYKRLMPWDYIWFVLPYIGDCFVGPENTNGRCMLYLRTAVIPWYHFFIRFFVWIWKKRMMSLYPGEGPRGFRRIYFGAEHAITRYTPNKF